MTAIRTNELLSCLLEILQKLAESGAEIYRIEESAWRIGNAYGIDRTDVYAITSSIIVSVETEPGTIQTHTRRVTQISTDIERLDRLNALVRYITSHTPDAETIRAKLREIEDTPTYPLWITYAFYGVIAGVFYLFFGGRSIVELVVSTLVGLLVGCLSMLIPKFNSNMLLNRFLCSFVACSVIFACRKVQLIQNVDYIIIGNIMTLIPGIGLTNALRDLFTGDSLSGVLRMIESILMALAIACGFAVTTLLFGGAL